MQQAEAAAKSRSPSYRAGYLGFPPCSHQGREQRGCRATAQALRVTFPPAQSSGFVPACSGNLRLPLPQPGFGAGNPTARGASGLRLLGPFFHLVFPSGRGSSDPERWPWGPSELGERRSRAPPRLNAPQRGPPAFSCCPFRHLEGKFPHCKRSPRNGTELSAPRGNVTQGPTALGSAPFATMGTAGMLPGRGNFKEAFPWLFNQILETCPLSAERIAP